MHWTALNDADCCSASPSAILPGLFGGDADIASRGSLQGRWLARLASDWIKKRAEIRHARKAPPQSLVLVDGKPLTSPRDAGNAFVHNGGAGGDGRAADWD